MILYILGFYGLKLFPNQVERFFFVPFEIGGLLKKQKPSPSHYQVLFYAFSPQTEGYAIFEKKRLLMARLFLQQR
ncbi:hypothetical protein QM565_35570 [Geitlerinema splendidum]|nr:hypothetical protein [Geitlerinema splendidum]